MLSDAGAEAPVTGLSFGPFMCLCLAKTSVAGSEPVNKRCPGWSRPVSPGTLVTLSSGCARALWSGGAQFWQPAMQSGWHGCLSYCPCVGVLQRCRMPTSLAVEVQFYLSRELGAVNLNSVQGEENALFAHLPLFRPLLLLLTGGEQVLLTVLCWEPTCLSCLLWALVETCWLSRTKLKFLMPHPVSLFHLAVMP